jgi:hypothetical protein
VIPISSPIQVSDEAEEAKAVLSSTLFASSPNLVRLLKYLCANHFSEKRSSLNEYRIGVEALGRPPDFDPAKNSSVRVEMHRLRGKLRSYYETEGADHTINIILEEGRYGLQFVRSENGRPGASVESGLRNPGEEQGRRLFGHGYPRGGPLVAGNSAEKAKEIHIPYVSTKGAAIAATVVILAFVFVWTLIGARSRGRLAFLPIASPSSVAGAATAMESDTGSVLILAGYPKEKYVDRDGKIWGGDRYFTGGEAVELQVPFIQGTADPTVYRTARIGEFSYDIPVKPGMYELRLHFVETTFGPGTYVGRGESSRVFSVFMGEKPLLTHFDVLSDAGGNYRAFTRVFKGVSANSDGKIHLKFLRDLDQPFVNAIEVVPEIDGRMNAVRIVMQDSSYVDHVGHLWSADQYAIGGVLVNHQNPAVNVPDPHLFDGERFGHFTYQIPVAPGRYTVTLHFTEEYFGTEAARNDHGPRVFDVYVNGESLLRNFDILEKAGGPDKPITETFHAIEPNAAGLIVLSFLPVKNYACVNAIEVTDEAPLSRR